MSDPQYAKRGGGGGGGEGGNCTLQALYPPPYSIYLLIGDGIKPSFGMGGSFIPPPPPVSYPDPRQPQQWMDYITTTWK